MILIDFRFFHDKTYLGEVYDIVYCYVSYNFAFSTNGRYYILLRLHIEDHRGESRALFVGGVVRIYGIVYYPIYLGHVAYAKGLGLAPVLKMSHCVFAEA